MTLYVPQLSIGKQASVLMEVSEDVSASSPNNPHPLAQ